MDFTSKFNSGKEGELFHEALNIYVDRQYYVFEGIKKFEKGDDVEKIIENYLIQETWESMTEDDFENSFDYSECLSDSSQLMIWPQKDLGQDEIDWDSHDK